MSFIVIDMNFNPDVAVSHGKEHMSILLNDWESNYHQRVSEIFSKLRKEYLNEIL